MEKLVVPRLRVLPLQAAGMQEQTPEPLRFQPVVPLLIAVTIVTGHRMSCMRRMHADLMSPSGPDPNVCQSGAGKDFRTSKNAARGLSCRADLDRALALLARIAVESRLHR